MWSTINIFRPNNYSYNKDTVLLTEYSVEP